MNTQKQSDAYKEAQVRLHQEAIAKYTEVIRLDSGDASAYHNRGLDKAQLGMFEDAIADYDEAIKLDPRIPSFAYGNRGWAKVQLGRYEDAITDFDEASG